MPRFVLGDDEWLIAQDGARLLLTADGKESVRKFVSADHAAVQYAKLIAVKEAEGWALGAATPSKVAAAQLEPNEPELERAIAADPYDREAYAVYGDWYQAQQHPRGELIALQLAGDDDRKIAQATRAHLARHKTVLLGPLATYADPGSESPFRWNFGFIHALELDLAGEEAKLGELVRAVVAHPSGRFLTEVTIRDVDQRAIEAALRELRPETLRVLKIVTTSRLDQIDVIAQAPLRRLAIKAHDSEGLTERALATLTRVQPTLVDLHLRCEGPREQWSALAPLFARTDLVIERLAIRMPHLVDRILAELGASAVGPRIGRLDFALTDPETGVRDLIAQRERFAALTEIVLSGDRVISRAVSDLKKLVRKVSDVRMDPDDRIFALDQDFDYEDIRE
ncbi:hypothetical protein BH11MYX1_BH11MYX1_26030 [soil metagenome]